MHQFPAYIRARAAFKLFMFSGTLCIFGVAFRQFASLFQMAGTIIYINHLHTNLITESRKYGLLSASVSNGKTVQWRDEADEAAIENSERGISR